MNHHEKLGLTKSEYRIKYIKALLCYITYPLSLLSMDGWIAIAWFIYVYKLIKEKANPFTREAMVMFDNIIREVYHDIERDENLKQKRAIFIDTQWNNLKG